MIKSFKKILLSLIFIQTFLQIIKSVTYHGYTQSTFNSIMQQIRTDPGRASFTNIFIDSYDGGWHDIKDISAISAISECVSLTTFGIQMGLQGYTQEGFDQTMAALMPLKKIKDLYIFFYHGNGSVRVNSVMTLKPVLMQLPGLTRLYLHFGYNQITDFCESLAEPITKMKDLKKELYLVFYMNRNDNCNCFDGMFDDMTQLIKLHINFQSNKFTTMQPFTNAFRNVTQVTELTLNLMHNDINVFTLQESFTTLTKLNNLYLYAGRTKGQGVSDFKNFTVYNSNISYYRVFMKEGVYNAASSVDMFANMPKLKTVYIYFRDAGYKYQDLKNVVDAIAKAPLFENLQMEFVYTPKSDPFDYDEWGDLLDNIRDKIRYLYIYDHASYANIYNMTNFSHILRDTPKLYKLYLRTYTNRNEKIPARIDHPFITDVTYVQYSNSLARNTLDRHGEIFDGFPALRYPYIEFSYCSLNDDDMNNYHHIFKSMSGRNFGKQVYLNLRNNKITDTSFLFNPYQKISTPGYLYVHLQYNQIQNFTNFQRNLETLMDPSWNMITLYLEYNKITDVKGLSTAFQNYSMKYIMIQMAYNQLTDYSQFNGIVDGQHGNLDMMRLYLYSNPCQVNQTQLNDVLLPVTRNGGKSWVNTYYFSFIDPDYGTNYGKGSLRSAGQYPAITDKGVCWSNWGQSYFYYETTVIQEDESTKIKKNCGKCHNTRCHSCIENFSIVNEEYIGQQTSSKCTECRKTDPQRIGDNCDCPVGYYDGPSNHECLKCNKLCTACDNGNTCLSEAHCVTSVPKRLTTSCVCPNKYFDNGTSNQCQNCIIGCNKCTNSSTCTECLDGYYLNNSNICVKCPNKFKTCSSATVGKQCQGLNRTSVIPNCLCQSGYYDDNINADCKICVNNCKTCSSSNICLSCVSGYFLNGSTCQKCPNKFKECQTNTIGKVCQGTNRTSVIPNCYCNDGYYDDNTNANCVQCINNCGNCKSSTHCLTCVAGYYLNNTQCSKCLNKFETCETQNKGTKCQGQNRSNNLPNCECQQGFVDIDSTNLADCVQCTSPCKQCINSKTKCTSCIDGYYLDGNSCIKCHNRFAKCSNATTGIECKGSNRSSLIPNCPCNDTFYDDNINSNCVACTNNCNHCESENICKNCIDGYYKDGVNCLKCLNKFEICNDFSTGTKCQGSNRSNNLPNCECSLGYVDIDGSNQANCSQCTSPCKSCENSQTKCLSCIEGYYKNGNQCLQCLKKYETCSDSITGTKCQGTGRTSNLPNCECQIGFIDEDGTNLQNCTKCESPCKTCINNKSKCVSCIDGYYLDGNTCVKCQNKFSKCSDAVTGTECQGSNRSNNLPNCECNTLYYDNGQNQSDCVLCEYPCLTCDSQSVCTSCTDSIDRNNDSGCTCHVGFYDNFTQKGCRSCLYKCKECNITLDNCQSCPEDSFRDNSNNDCTCIDGYFDIVDEPICNQCIHPCKHCVSLTICTECLFSGTNRNNAQGNPSCGCMDGYYETEDFQCLKCPNKCNKCSDADTCIDCNLDPNKNRSLQISDNCGCEDGYYDDQENPNTLQCAQCQYPCVHCISREICIAGQCATVENRNMYSRLCDCDDGYYDNGIECLKCSLQCITCHTRSDFCTGMQCAGTTRKNYPYCTCIDGLKEIGGVDCGVCDNKCLECSLGQSSNCTKCVQGFKRQQINKNCECQDGFYDDGQNADCLPCKSSCKTCQDSESCLTCHTDQLDPNKLCISNVDQTYASFSVVNPQTNIIQEGQCSIGCRECQDVSTNCTSCIIGLNRSNQVPHCSCNDGYHDSNGQTQDCQYQCDLRCLKCVDFNQCTVCNEQENWELNPLQMMCKCKSGYKQENQSNYKPICIKCEFIYRNLCVDKCPESTIPNEENHICYDVEYEKESSLIPSIIIGSIIIAVQIMLFLALRMIFKRFMSNNLPIHIQKQKEIDQQEEADRKLYQPKKIDVESYNSNRKLNNINQIDVFNDEFSNSNDSQDANSLQNQRKDLQIDNQEDLETVRNNIQKRQSLKQKRLSHVMKFRGKSQIIQQRQQQQSIQDINDSPNINNNQPKRKSHFIN